MIIEAKGRFLHGLRTTLPKVPAISMALSGALYAETMMNPSNVEAGGMQRRKSY